MRSRDTWAWIFSWSLPNMHWARLAGATTAHPLQSALVSANARKDDLTVRATSHWNRLPRDGVDAPILEGVKDRLNGYLAGMA